MSNTTMLCAKDRKVWKHYRFAWSMMEPISMSSIKCPTCSEPGRDMGTKWRAPKLTNKKAWARIDQEDFLWENPKPKRSGHRSGYYNVQPL